MYFIAFFYFVICLWTAFMTKKVVFSVLMMLLRLKILSLLTQIKEVHGK